MKRNMKVYSPEIMQSAEKYLFDKKGVSPVSLMKEAAHGMYELIKDRLRRLTRYVYCAEKETTPATDMSLQDL